MKSISGGKGIQQGIDGLPDDLVDSPDNDRLIAIERRGSMTCQPKNMIRRAPDDDPEAKQGVLRE